MGTEPSKDLQKNNWWNRSFQLKLLSLVCFVVFMSLIINEGIAFWNIRQVRKKSIQALKGTLTEKQEAFISSRLSSVSDRFGLWIDSNRNILLGVKEHCQFLLKEKAVEKQKTFSSFLKYLLEDGQKLGRERAYFVDLKEGKIFLEQVTTRKNTFLGDVAILANFWKENKNEIIVIPPVGNFFGDSQSFGFILPLYVEGALAGILGLDINLKQGFSSALRQMESAFLLDNNLNILQMSMDIQNLLGLGTEQSWGTVTEQKSNWTQSLVKEVSELKIKEEKAPQIHFLKLSDAKNFQAEYGLSTRSSDQFFIYNKPSNRVEECCFYLGILIPNSELNKSLNKVSGEVLESTHYLYSMQIFILTGSLLFALAASWFVSRPLVKRIQALAQAVRLLEGKKYNVSLEIESVDEIGQLALAFNRMVAEIRNYTQNLEGIVKERTYALQFANLEVEKLNARLKEENLKLGADIEVTKQMQMMILPADKDLKAIKAFDISGFMESADNVGGDYYDVLTSEKSLKIGIGDVTGHGIESGMLMLMVQTIARTLFNSDEKDSVKFLSLLNKALYDNILRIGTNKNLTLLFANFIKDQVEICGQHEEVLIIRSNGVLERIDTMELGFPVGLERDINDFIKATTFPFAAGDVAVFFTDGVTEAEDPEGQFYGIERLCEVAQQSYKASAEEIKSAIIEDLKKHISTQVVHDDITLLVVKKNADEIS